jgi:hypothetical protein
MAICIILLKVLYNNIWLKDIYIIWLLDIIINVTIITVNRTHAPVRYGWELRRWVYNSFKGVIMEFYMG